jgi:hypothetical protein
MADLMTASILLRKPYVPVAGDAGSAATAWWRRVPLQQCLPRAAKRLVERTGRGAASPGEEARTCVSR